MGSSQQIKPDDVMRFLKVIASGLIEQQITKTKKTPKKLVLPVSRDFIVRYRTDSSWAALVIPCPAKWEHKNHK
jgi:hypothetical protein